MGIGPRGVATADLDGDGDLDIVIGNGQSQSCSILQSDGIGHFQLISTIETGPYPYSVSTGDLNHDSVPDLVVGHFGGAAIHLGHGDGTFAPVTLFPMFGSVSIGLADVNGDGHLDIAAAGFDANAALIALGGGDGWFGEPAAYGVALHPISIAVADLDHDGSPDLALGRDATSPGENVSTVTVLFGNGDGSFGGQVDVLTGSRPRRVALADVNDDGWPDLLASNFGAGTVSVLLGHEDGTFGPKLDVSAGSDPEALTVADLNQDGNLDIAVIRVLYEGKVTLLFGSGDGSFPCTGELPVGSIPTAIVSGEFAGDGKPGLVIANENSNTASALVTESQAFTATLDLDPDVIQLASRAPWVTAYIEPSGFDPASIDLPTLRLAGVTPVPSKSVAVGDHNENGMPDLAVRFSREALDPLLLQGENELDLTGSLVTGESFTCTDIIKVLALPAPFTASVTPNPLNPAGVLRFQTSKLGPVNVTMFDVQGRLVRILMDASALPEGAHNVTVDGKGEQGQSLASGVYLYRIEAAEGVVTGRIAILK